MTIAINEGALAIDAFGLELQRAQSEMETVRNNAMSAGLTVDGAIIQDAAEEALIDAYNSAFHAAEAARTMEKLGADTLKNAWTDLRTKWFFVVADLINGGAAALVDINVSTMLKQSNFFAEESAKSLSRARSATPGTPAATIYRDIDDGKALARQADDIATKAEATKANAGRVGLKVGGALAAAGVVYDIANGKDVDQAIVSGAAGFGASILAGAGAGAIIGTAIPIPGVGTVGGALVGATVGIFTSGAVDSLYQNGIGSLGDAITDGATAVADTGKAIGGLAKGAWDAIF
ncbi:hypothetical protein [Mycobacterium sp. DBP42]|uniref:hypothetical protein n=1 Tax=Mycobacterium sp. DBP42 TaxID=2545267 RepID=UPI00110CAB3C|nr:hypothetical protein [Mycobacterium sp. DBP42]TMS54646.1 hypothetical protein E0T84_07580 [Mycobacterium sp. DBP42]